MKDLINLEAPFNVIGKLFNKIYLTGYLKNLIKKRNAYIKVYAESGDWKNILYS